MKTTVIDFNDFSNAGEVHAFLKTRLAFPDYYGANLDALYDLLTEPGSDETNVIVLGVNPPLSDGFLDVFKDAAAVNPRFTFAVRRD